jgi:twitching motility protein PilT
LYETELNPPQTEINLLGIGWAIVAPGVTPFSDHGSMAVEPRLDAWLAALDERDGTDILLTHDSPPLLRVDGRLSPLDGAEPLTGDEIEVIARSQIKDQYGDRLHQGRDVDFSFSWRDKARIRANAFYQRGNCSLSIRRIPMRIPTPSDLGIPGVMAGILRNPSGIILVTGPTGSGKSTTMAAMVDTINRIRPCHIITIEDPIEYLHTNQQAAVSQREVGTDTESFDRALRSALREDPDVVMVGEMRDLESISFALTIAETGHLVLATMHTNDSAQTIDRIIDVFPAERRPQIQVQLAGTLLAVIYQRLVPKLNAGMVAAYEIMVGVPAVRNLVREGKTRQLRNVVATHRADGMQTLEYSLETLIQQGTIDYQTAIDASIYPQDIAKPPQAALASNGGGRR